MLVVVSACGSPDYARWVGKSDPLAKVTPDAAPVAVDPSLLAYWRFDDGVGSAVADSSGRGNDGTVLGNGTSPTPVWTTGNAGGALALDGQTFVRVPYSSDWDQIQTTNAFTVVGWVMRQTPIIGWNSVVTRQFQGTTWEHFELSFKDDHVVSVASSQINPDWYCTAPLPTASGLWMHIAGTYDGTIVRGYENGIEVCNLAFSATLVADNTGVVIGGEDNTADRTVNQFFTGLVDDIAIYSRAMSPGEIAEIAAGKAIVP